MGALLDKTKRQDTFLSIPEVAWLHPQVITAHQGVLAARLVEDGPSEAMRTIIEKGLKIDFRHDHLARGISFSLDAEREHCLGAEEPENERASVCERVGKQLFPEGLTIITGSYLAESGNTARVGKLLEDEPQIGKLLKTVAASGNGKKTLFDAVMQWIKVGAELAALEHERETLIAKEGAEVAPERTLTVRARWIRVVNAILGNLDMASGPAEAIDAIRGPIVRASDRAAKRYATGATDTSALDPEGPKPAAPATPPNA